MLQLHTNVNVLREFEKGLDPAYPERSKIPAKILDYGEISAVFEIEKEGIKDLVFKRLSIFRTEEEAQHYEALHLEYLDILQDRIGVPIVPTETILIPNKDNDRITLYLIQKKVPPETIGHNAIHRLSNHDVNRLVLAILKHTKKVFDFNRRHKRDVEIGFDSQISNWAIFNFNTHTLKLDEDIELRYFDTSTPLLRRHNEEQLNTELFLRTTPSLLTWVFRRFYLDDVINRYYHLRQVALDLVANFYKEKRQDLIPGIIDILNTFCGATIRENGFKPITRRDVISYYRQDAWMCRLYLAFRKIDRRLHGLSGREYPHILPGKIVR